MIFEGSNNPHNIFGPSGSCARNLRVEPKTLNTRKGVSRAADPLTFAVELWHLPGLPKTPAAERIDVDDKGKITGAVLVTPKECFAFFWGPPRRRRATSWGNDYPSPCGREQKGGGLTVRLQPLHVGEDVASHRLFAFVKFLK